MASVFPLAPLKLCLGRQPSPSQGEQEPLSALATVISSPFVLDRSCCLTFCVSKVVPPYFLLSPDLGRGKSGFEMSCSIANACCTLLLLWFNCTVPADCCGPQSVCTEQAWPGNDLRLVAELLYFNLLINFLLRIEKRSLATGLCCISDVLRITWGLIWCLINIPQLKLLNVAQFWCSFCHSLERLCSL